MSKALEELRNDISNGSLLFSDEKCDAIERELKTLYIITDGFKISYYHTRHNSTGYELCIQDPDGNCVYKEITETEYEVLNDSRT